MICLILSQWKCLKEPSANHLLGQYAAALLHGLGSKSWPPPSESSSVPCPMTWALDSVSRHLNCSLTEAEGKEVEQDQRGPLFSWLEKPPTNMKAAWGWLDTGPEPIFSRWSFHHRTILSLLAIDAKPWPWLRPV